MDTAIRKATRLEYQPPKRKHLDTLVSLTHQNPSSIGDMMHTLEKRTRENSWIIAYKVLIIIHVLMREGNGQHVIDYVYNNMGLLEFRLRDNKSSTQAQVQNIRTYKDYLVRKVEAYGETRIDQVKSTGQNKQGRLRHLSVANGLLKETEVLQKQIASIMNCKLNIHGVDGEISLFAYRLVLEDLLGCFQALNEGIVNILEHYFAMSKPDARRSLDIYKRFAKQTEETHTYLDHAKRFENDMNLNIPSVKHAPLSLAAALEEYLNDPDFESKQDSYTKNNNSTPQTKQPEQPKNETPAVTQPSAPPPIQQSNTLPSVSTDSTPVVDFFGSIENDQATVFHQPSTSFMASQSTGSLFPPMQQPIATGSNPFRTSAQPMSMQGLSAQPTGLSTGVSSQATGNQSNPFRTFPSTQSMSFLPQQSTGWSQPSFSQQQPFQQQQMMTGASSFSTFPQQQTQQQSQQPFNNNIYVAPQATGSHNPFL
ncbi:ANTH domain-containing protein [Fennellomyces sp. T-0311]|nr:ANTH domain-containing protein [Fennellomyces sp. T-0311]